MMKPKISIAVLGLGPVPKRSSLPPRFGGASSAKPADEKPEDVEISESPMEAEDEDEETRGDEVATVSPEAVCFRDETQVCGNCRHMGGDGCKILKIPCSPGDSCNAFSERGVREAEEPEKSEEDENAVEAA